MTLEILDFYRSFSIFVFLIPIVIIILVSFAPLVLQTILGVVMFNFNLFSLTRGFQRMICQFWNEHLTATSQLIPIHK